jgi:hypothetical protein
VNEKSCKSSAPTVKVPSHVATMTSTPNSSGTAQMTASNNIAAKTTELVSSKSKKTCSNAKVLRGPGDNPEPESEPKSINLSDEDNSLESEATLSSPIKRMALRKSSEVS